MKNLKLFNFQGTPIYLSIWFLLMFLIFPVTTTIGIFISVLLHEIGHAWMANYKGYNVHQINIDFFSGSAHIDSINSDKDNIYITAAGPAVNLILFTLYYIINIFFPNPFFNIMFIINIYLFIFNILPIYPMDGGQIVRSFANLSPNKWMARRIASIISIVFSIALVIWGIWHLAFILSIIGVYFAYVSLKELGYVS